jgi:hypothetical protein
MIYDLRLTGWVKYLTLVLCDIDFLQIRFEKNIHKYGIRKCPKEKVAFRIWHVPIQVWVCYLSDSKRKIHYACHRTKYWGNTWTSQIQMPENWIKHIIITLNNVYSSPHITGDWGAWIARANIQLIQNVYICFFFKKRLLVEGKT